MLLVKGCGKSLGGPFFFTFHTGIIPKPAPVFCRQGLQRLRQAIYSSGLHLKVRSLNLDWERIRVLFSPPLPVRRREMLVNLYFEKVRLLNYPHIWCVCVWLFVCVFAYFLQHGLLSSSTTVCQDTVHPPQFDVLFLCCPLLIHCLLCLPNLCVGQTLHFTKRAVIQAQSKWKHTHLLFSLEMMKSLNKLEMLFKKKKYYVSSFDVRQPGLWPNMIR